MLLQKNIALKNYTTFKIGGTVRYFVEVKNEDELNDALKFADKENLPIFILGGGSNILVSDQGFNGLVIKMNNTFLSFRPKAPMNIGAEAEESFTFSDEKTKRSLGKLGMTKEETNILAGAGTNLNLLIQKCWEKNLVGLENLFGIYGTLGGAIRGNAGAFGSEIADFIESVHVFAIKQSKKNKSNVCCQKKILFKKQCAFAYRDSIFKKKENYIIWSVALNLKQGSIPAAKKQAREILKLRGTDKNLLPSAGCVFKNIKDKKFAEFIKSNPKVKLPQSFYERQSLPVAWLIEKLNLKNFCLGDAQVSVTHANFIINKNNATAQNVVDLIKLIKKKIKENFKIVLQEEIQYIGF